MIPVEFASISDYEVIDIYLKSQDGSDKEDHIHGYFTSLRVDERSIPVGMFKYDIRGDDDCGDEPVSLNKHVLVNHFGTIITNDWVWLKPDEKTGRALDVDIVRLDFTPEHYKPPKMVYAIASQGYDQFDICRIYNDWKTVVAVFETYERRNKLFISKNSIPELGFRIVAYPVFDKPIPDIEIPKQVRAVQSLSGMDISSTFDCDCYDDDDDMHPKVDVEIFDDDSIYGELIVFVDVESNDDYGTLMVKAYAKCTEYTNTLLDAGTNIRPVINCDPKIDVKWLTEHGFVNYKNSSYRLYLDGGPNVGDNASV